MSQSNENFNQNNPKSLSNVHSVNKIEIHSPCMPSPNKYFNKKSLKCMYTNTDALTNKLEELELFLHSEKIDIVAITETIPKNHSSDEKFNFDSLQGYTCIDCQEGRGVCLFIKSSLQVTRCSDFEGLFSPSVFCKVVLSKEKTIVIGVLYRSPNSDETEFNNMLKQLKYVQSVTKQSGEKLVLLGDFNLSEIDWVEESCTKNIDHIASRFLEFTKVHDLSQFVKKTHPLQDYPDPNSHRPNIVK